MPKQPFDKGIGGIDGIGRSEIINEQASINFQVSSDSLDVRSVDLSVVSSGGLNGGESLDGTSTAVYSPRCQRDHHDQLSLRTG